MKLIHTMINIAFSIAISFLIAFIILLLSANPRFISWQLIASKLIPLVALVVILGVLIKLFSQRRNAAAWVSLVSFLVALLSLVVFLHDGFRSKAALFVALAELGLGVLASRFAAFHPNIFWHRGPWIDIREEGQAQKFSVRQRLMQPLRNSLIIFIPLALIASYCAWKIQYVDESDGASGAKALISLAIIVIIALPLVVSFLLGALNIFKITSDPVAEFEIWPDQLVIHWPKSGGATKSMLLSDLLGPFYIAGARQGPIAPAVVHETVVVVGPGASSWDISQALSARQAGVQTGEAISQLTEFAVDFIARGSNACVFVEHQGRREVLARSLNQGEAAFLAAKVQAAMNRQQR